MQQVSLRLRILQKRPSNISENKVQNSDRRRKVIEKTVIQSQKEYVAEMFEPSRMMERLKEKDSPFFYEP